MSFHSILLFALVIFMTGVLLIVVLGKGLFLPKSSQSKAVIRKSPVPAPKVYTETAVLLQKIDERRRVMDEYRHTKITDEYFELVFELQNGEMLRLSCSKAAYREMPFRKTGILTCCDGRLIRFKTPEQVISDEYSSV